MTRVSLFLTGALFGAACVGFVALMNWPTRYARVVETTPASVPVATPAASTPSPTVVAPASLPPPSAAISDLALPMSAQPAPLGSPPAAAATTSQVLPPPPTSLLIPVAGVKASALSDTFTDARSEGRVHDAIDIMAPRGTPVLAATDGKVVKLFDSKRGGLTVYQFDPGETYAYYYAHLDSYAPGVIEGRPLKRGDLVGYVGSTGNASPDAPHLHFAIFVLGPEKNWWQGTAINPYPLLHGK